MPVLIICLLFTSFAAKAQSVYHVVSPSAELMSLPNPGSSRLALLSKGDEVNYLKTMESGSWAKVSFEGQIGYMEVAHIKEGKMEVKATVAEVKKYHVVVFQSAIYASPDFSANKLKTLVRDEILEVFVGDDIEWLKVKTKTGVGYVFGAHMEEGLPKKEEKAEDEVIEIYTVRVDVPAFAGKDKKSKVMAKFERGDLVDVVLAEDGWARVKLPQGYGYIELSALDKPETPTGGASKGKVNPGDIGKSKDPIKFGAICRDGSTDYSVGPHTCSKGNGVQMWIYKKP